MKINGLQIFCPCFFQKMVLLYLSWLPQRSKALPYTDVSHMAVESICFRNSSTLTLEKHIIYIYMVDRNFKVIMFLNVNLYCLYDTLWFYFLWFLDKSLPTLKRISDVYTSSRIMTCGSVSINAVIGDH